MNERDDTTQNQQDQETDGRTIDDRRGDVKPTDNPVPSSPEPDADAVRQSEENLDRVKPY